MSHSFDPTVGVQRLYWSKNFKPGVPFSNGSGYSNPEVDRLLESAAVEIDPERRRALFREFQVIIATDLPDINRVTGSSLTIANKKVQDHTTTIDGPSANFLMSGSIPDHSNNEISAMNFDIDITNPYFAKAVELRKIFGQDAIARDKAGGRPVQELRLLKESGLLNILIPSEYGGASEPWSTVLKISREFAKVDGSLAHLYGYHFSSVQSASLRGTLEQSANFYRRSVAGNWFWGNTANSFSKSLFGRVEGEWYILDGFRPFASGSHIADYLQVAWEDHITGERSFAAIPANREGIRIEDDWDGIGQRQTGSGRVSYTGVRIHQDEVFKFTSGEAQPYQTLTPFQQQSVLLNVFVGTAQGALLAARDYTNEKSRPWIYSGVERHIDDPWIKRVYGDLYIKTQAATHLADDAAEALDDIAAKGRDLTESERGKAAIRIAAANVYAGNVALEVTSQIFEVMGARSATNASGFDRFWRNVRIHTLHNPAEYKTRNVGTWFLTGEHPAPGTFQ